MTIECSTFDSLAYTYVMCRSRCIATELTVATCRPSLAHNRNYIQEAHLKEQPHVLAVIG